MRRSYKRSVRKDLYARKHEPKKRKKKGSRHVVVKGKRKLYHKVGQHRVHGIWYKGRFYSPKHHYKPGTVVHHSIRHKGVTYHSVHKDKSANITTAWEMIKDKYKTLKHWNTERVERNKYYKENLNAKEREKVAKLTHDKDYYKAERMKADVKQKELQSKYDAEERKKAYEDH